MKKLVVILSILNFNLLFSAASSSREIVTIDNDEDYCCVDFRSRQEKMYREFGLYDSKVYKDIVKILFDSCKNGRIGTVDAILKSKKVDVDVNYDKKFNIEQELDIERYRPMMLIAGRFSTAEDAIVGFTPLMWAIFHRQKEVIKLLLSYRPEINAKSEFGITALMIAVAQDDKEMVELLIANGANANIKSHDGCSLVRNAASYGYLSAAKMLTNFYDVNAKDKFGNPEFIALVQENKKEICELLFRNGVNVNSKNIMGNTALMLVTMLGGSDLVEWLIEMGANVNEGLDRHTTALSIALMRLRFWERYQHPNREEQLKRYTHIIEVLKKNGAIE